MNRTSSRYLCWAAVLGFAAALALLALGTAFLYQRDAAVEEAVRQLRPGMSDLEVRELLQPVRAAQVTTESGGVAYLFYGVDEFVTVQMDGDGARVATVGHMPDVGPRWERARRNWERRLR
jgi:hypothetical protein